MSSARITTLLICALPLADQSMLFEILTDHEAVVPADNRLVRVFCAVDRAGDVALQERAAKNGSSTAGGYHPFQEIS
ncbi:hypothetical protein D3C81_2044220 [compost metagenome]